MQRRGGPSARLTILQPKMGDEGVYAHLLLEEGVLSVIAMFHQLPALTWNRTPLRKENEGDTYIDARIHDIANYPATDRVITVPAIE
jgi:hypothetical protein